MLTRKRKTSAGGGECVQDAVSGIRQRASQDDGQRDVVIENHVERMRRLSSQPQKAAIVASILDTVFNAIEHYPLDKLPESTMSGTQMLVKLLQETEASRLAPADGDPLESARVRGLAARERLLKAEGSPLTVSQVEKMLGISRQAIHKRCSKGKLIALRTSKRGYLFPRWQFTDKGILPGLEEVLTELNEDDPWMQASFILNPNIWLDGVKPLEMLQQGKISEVIVAAHASGEQGAA